MTAPQPRELEGELLMTVVDSPADGDGTYVVRRYGLWDSPLTAEAAGAASGTPTWPSVVGPETWWCESRAAASTLKLMRCAGPGEPAEDVLGGDWRVSNGAIGYGGRPYLAWAGDDGHRVVFTHSPDGRLYAAEVPPAGIGAGDGVGDGDGATAQDVRPRPLTPPDEDGTDTSYADPVLGPGGEEVWCVREVVRGGEDGAARTVARDIVAVPLSGDGSAQPRVVGASHDFLSGIRVSPDGSRICWIGWNHPAMPWDDSVLMVARIVDGRAVEAVPILGGAGVSVPQAEWAGPASLYAMADPDGWWNLHRVTLGSGSGSGSGSDGHRDGHRDGEADAASAVRVECVLPTDSECSHAIWRVGATSFAVTDAGVVFRHGVGDQQVVLWDPATEAVTDLAGEWTEFAIGLRGDAASVAVIAASPTERAAPVRIDVAQARARRCLPAADDPFEPWHSTPERRRAQRADGSPVHFVYYPPASPNHIGPDDELPPLIIDVHGGPTSTTGGSRALTLSVFTSRGFAVASVDYGGSTGYGRAYRDRLLRNWGIVDVEDSVAVAHALAEAGLVDPARTAVRGGSSGGWTTLAALAHTDAFCCGAVYYPISDPLTWSGEQTHDFESRYLESLVGVLPEDEEHYRRVSPLAHAGSITAPYVMLQGLDDRICRPDQAERLVAATAPGLCRAFLRFPGEGHGFRRAASISASLEAELALFTDVMVLR
jgi:dipeptidyl aminopeptidase/acylaminoacyl peptidase